MKCPRLIQSFIFLCLVFSAESFAAAGPYRLGIVLVIDQLRADYFSRFENQFIPTTGKGLKMLMQQGSYFPLADHGLLQNMTGPGHAAILTGSYPYRNHISMNHWFEREKGITQYCVQDDPQRIIGSDGPITNLPYGLLGVSPKNMNATTVGDELKNVDRPSRVVSIALKDRAAVLMGGKRADEVYWFESKSCQWVSSEFYTKTLPDYIKKINTKFKPLTQKTMSWGPYQNVKYCSSESTQTPWMVDETFKMALATVDQLKLGQGKDTDLLLVSLSSHDYLGHRIGPNDAHMGTMMLDEDRMIGQFLSAIAKKLPNGLNDVFVVLTGDHGVPPHPKHLPTERLPAENVPEELAPKIIEEVLTQEFGKPEGGKWIAGMAEFQIYFNLKALEKAKISINKAVAAVRPKLLKERYLDAVWSRDEIMFERKVPAGEYGVVLDRTLSHRSGDMILQLKPFFYSDSYPVTHMTMYSYDRFVPLIFWGKNFKPGIYRQLVKIVDIAPTLSSTLGVIPPSQSEGRVINEILR